MTRAILPNLTEIPPERSTHIARIGHDADFLFVEFRNREGELFRYDQVSKQEYEALMAAPSLGMAFSKSIKGLKPYQRMEAGTNLIAMPKKATSTTALQEKAQQWSQRAMALRVHDVATHEQAQQIILRIADTRKEITDFIDPMREQALRAWKTIVAQQNSLLDPLEAADKALRRQVGEYTYAEVRKAEEADRLAREQAEQEARARAIQETEANALKAAEELFAMGDIEGADAVLEHPVPADIEYRMPPPIAPQVATVEGITGSLVYEVTIHDIQAVPREFLVVDMAKTTNEIARRAKQVQGRLQVAGVTIRETYATRRAGGRR